MFLFLSFYQEVCVCARLLGSFPSRKYPVIYCISNSDIDLLNWTNWIRRRSNYVGYNNCRAKWFPMCLGINPKRKRLFHLNLKRSAADLNLQKGARKRRGYRKKFDIDPEVLQTGLYMYLSLSFESMLSVQDHHIFSHI